MRILTLPILSTKIWPLRMVSHPRSTTLRESIRYLARKEKKEKRKTEKKEKKSKEKKKERKKKRKRKQKKEKKSTLIMVISRVTFCSSFSSACFNWLEKGGFEGRKR